MKKDKMHDDVDFLIPLPSYRRKRVEAYQLCKIFATSLCLLVVLAFLATAGIYFWKLHTMRVQLYVGIFSDSAHNGPEDPASTGILPSEDVETESESKECSVPSMDDVLLCDQAKPSMSSQDCLARNCCWTVDIEGESLCFVRKSELAVEKRGGYVVFSVTETDVGLSATLEQKSPSTLQNDIPNLQLDVLMETQSRLRFKIYDPNHMRYEVPMVTPRVAKAASSTDYKVNVGKVGSEFHITVTRRATGAVLFDNSKTRLVFSDQFIQINTTLSSNYVYGLGEHRGRLLHNTSQPLKYAFWTRDIEPQEGCNLYGNHPFLIGVENDGNSHGIFLLNSNAMEVDILPGDPATLSYTTIGGILDFYVFTGPDPDSVVQQYNAVIGNPFMPPYWSLGFHLCRWGYDSARNLSMVIERNRAYGFPYDTQWSDIDYMDAHLDWTYDKVNYNSLPSIVQDLHGNGQHYIMIVDPGISNTTGYAPFEQGIALKVFVMAADGSAPILGKVWPGTTVFPDFWSPNAVNWWTEQVAAFHAQIPFDGLWTDMNEPSNFGSGSIIGCPGNSSLDYPPFTPPVCGGTLQVKTLCPSALHHIGTHYDLHSLYGHSEMVASDAALQAVRKGKRSLIISRSTFPSSGQHGGHWLGDNDAQWTDLAYSIAGILNFNFFGIPFVGADICGFGSDTTEELCVRWMQLGAFYPFMRNHNSIGQKDQDPGADWFSDGAKVAMKAALEQRYYLLPHLYTLLALSHINGSAVARPLFFQYPTDINALTNDRQFLWGDTLLIAPVLEQGASAITVYFPKDIWYEFASGTPVQGNGDYKSVNVTMSAIPVYQRGGTIIPVQAPNITTTLSRQNPFSLLIAVDESGKASGYLYWDDGDTLGATETGLFNWIIFYVAQNTLVSTIVQSGYTTNMPLTSIIIRGLSTVPSSATINGVSVPVTSGEQGIMLIPTNYVSLLSTLTATWM